MMKYFVSLMLLLLFTGCSSSVQVLVRDGACEPLENADLYYTRVGILSFVALHTYTDQTGKATLPQDTDTIMIEKQGYKPFYIGEVTSNFIEVFLYKSSEEHESGLIGFNACKEYLQ